MKDLKLRIDHASRVVGTTWPLYSFVTSNPLSGYENLNFKEACTQVFLQNGAIAYPNISFFKQAIESGLIEDIQIANCLQQHEFNGDLDDFFEVVNKIKSTYKQPDFTDVDQILTKWLSVFLDEGLADWQMPNREDGFYQAWLKLAKYDATIGVPKNYTFPTSSFEAIQTVVGHLDEAQQNKILEHHLAALPGWVGYIKYRINYQSEWHKNYPLALADYLAVRLLITKFKGLNLDVTSSISDQAKQALSILHTCLVAVESAWQEKFTSQLTTTAFSAKENVMPDAQMVFCIDTRSELIRRNIENKGNYETFGYAGFFGIAMDYQVPFTGITRKSCPPIVASAFQVNEKETPEKESSVQALHTSYRQSSFKKYFLKRMKNILPSAFGFVEGAGLIYGFQILKRTFVKGTSQDSTNSISVENACTTHIQKTADASLLTNEEQAQIVKSAFDLTGWKKFAPLVVFAGHGSHTANNPFASSLDCGACAASPGRHNARMLAQLANNKEVRAYLLSQYSINIPNETLFLGAEHNTTTDEIVLFDADAPAEFQAQLKALKAMLKEAQTTATQERLGSHNSVQHAFRKSLDWSETRPEWGLAKNAGFVIAPRQLTENLNLEGQCFLHSYDYQTDPKATALNAILNGPMVVTQWINNHYYFSTVDNQTFGGGSKITHNIVGKFGVVQGNGGDLKTGLPLQSVNQTDKENYHQPQRLSVFIYAPKEMVSNLLIENPHLKQLIENQWIHLLVIDPNQENKPMKYNTNGNWDIVKRKEILA